LPAIVRRLFGRRVRIDARFGTLSALRIVLLRHARILAALMEAL